MDWIISCLEVVMSKETTKKRSQSAKQGTQTKKKPGPQVKAKAKAKARQRQKQMLMIMIGLVAILLLVIVAALFLSGSIGGKSADSNFVYILENEKIVSTNIEAFDEEHYSKSELKSYMKDVIKDYNKENGSGSVRQRSFKIKDGIATSVLQYKNADVFEDFYGRELFVGTIGEALGAGYSFDIPFASVKGNNITECTNEKFIGDDTYKVAIIKANTKVKVEGEICFISTENIAEVEKDYVVIKEGAVLEMEAIDSTESTEVVSEDDLLEDGGLVFDFGEEEIVESEYSEKYTYIIYK